MTKFEEVITRCNNFDWKTTAQIWKFLVFDYPEPVGYMPQSFFAKIAWNRDIFEIDADKLAIRLNPPLNGKTHADACTAAFEDFCRGNVGNFKEAFKPWLAMSPEKRPYHPIIGFRGHLKDLKMPSPARGIFGNVTAGVHVNLYTTDPRFGNEKIDRIWVARRGPTITFPNALDQVMAGSVNPEDGMDPGEALRRISKEEAGLTFDPMWQIMSRDGVGLSRLVARDSPLAFYTSKDEHAGPKEAGHLEPGIRFVYDMRVSDKFLPRNACPEKILDITPMSVDEVCKSLADGKWKTNCALVMLDFLVRKGAIKAATESERETFEKGMEAYLPFKNLGEYYPSNTPPTNP